MLAKDLSTSSCSRRHDARHLRDRRARAVRQTSRAPTCPSSWRRPGPERRHRRGPEARSQRLPVTKTHRFPGLLACVQSQLACLKRADPGEGLNAASPVATTLIKATFGRYLRRGRGPDPDTPARARAPGGDKRTVTILMSDLRGFSAPLRASPEQVERIINNYLATMTEVIKKHKRATIDEFIGDAILAIFGAPVGRRRRSGPPPARWRCSSPCTPSTNTTTGRTTCPRSRWASRFTPARSSGNIGSEQRAKYGCGHRRESHLAHRDLHHRRADPVSDATFAAGSRRHRGRADGGEGEGPQGSP